MTTREAFTFLVHSPYLWKKTGLSKNTRRLYKHRISKDQWPSYDTMDTLVGSAFIVKQEKTWQIR